MKTLLDTLNGGTEWLEKRGIDDARRNMQLLLCEVLGFDNPMQLYTEFDKPLEEEELTPLREMLKQRSQGVPLQHIIGWVEFYKRRFKSDSRGLIPRPETEELVDLILKLELPEQAKILDMGTGSGVIGLSLAAELAERSAQVTLVDVSSDALALADENAESLALENISLKQSHLFKELGGSFDLIVANLPYIPQSEQDKLAAELAHDPSLALYSGADGLDLIRDFCNQSKGFLNDGGRLAMEIGIHQDKQVEKLLADAGFSAIYTKCDLNGVTRFPFATK